MHDPIQPVLEAIKENPKIQRGRRTLRPNFLNNVAEVFENHGFETTRLYLTDKKSQYATRQQAEVLLDVLHCMAACSAIHKRRAIGRTIIKTLDKA